MFTANSTSRFSAIFVASALRRINAPHIRVVGGARIIRPMRELGYCAGSGSARHDGRSGMTNTIPPHAERVECGMSAHTPGPWSTDRFWTMADNGCILIAKIYRTQQEPDIEGDANARLIAAAPELLEALRAISEAYLGDCPAAQDELAHAMGHIQYLRNLAHAAITKATARGDIE